MSTLDRSRADAGADVGLREHLSAAAKRQLDTLRELFDTRVDALEQALLDPGKTGSLVPLVLDLTRVATDEAEAAARQACLETQLEAQSAALSAVVTDRATIAELRATLDSMTLEGDRLKVEFERERERVLEAQRVLAEGRTRVEEAEARTSEAEARVASVEQRVYDLEAERTHWQGVQKQLTEQLERVKANISASETTAEGLRERLVQTERTAESRAAAAEGERARLEKTVREAEDRVRLAVSDRDARARERDARARDFVGLQQAAAEAAKQIDAMRREAEAQSALALKERGALTAAAARLEQKVATLERSLSEAQSHSSVLSDERAAAEGRLAALQQQTKAKETEWAERLRTAEGALRPRAAPRPSPSVDSAPPTASPSVPSARSAGVVAPQAGAVTAATPMVPKASARPATVPKAPEPQRVEPVATPIAAARVQEPGRTSGASASKIDSAESPTGVFSTVADALRAWTAETIESAGSGTANVTDVATPEPAPPSFDVVRESPRHNLTYREITIQVDGTDAHLVDLSTGGAQVLTAAMLKPGRQVRLSFPWEKNPSVGRAKVVWSRIETSGAERQQLRYRVGLAFNSIEGKAIEALLTAKR